MNRPTKVNIIAPLLALAAAIVSVVGITIYSYLHIVYGALPLSFLIIPILATSVTFITAKLGFKIKQKGQFSRTALTLIGAGLGCLAVLIVTTMILVLYIPKSSFGRAAPIMFSEAFIFGGFLGPLIGAIVGYREFNID